MNLARFIRRQLLSLSGVGLMLGALFFAAALTPTLIPRSYLTQGVLAGGCFAIGYFAGVLWRRLWHYLELPEPSARARSIANALAAVGCLLVVIVFLWRAAEWQNSIRAVMKMAPVETAHPLKVCVIALVSFVVLLVLGRLFALLARFLATHTRRVIPRKLANVIGVLAAGLLLWSIASNVLINTAFRALDSSFRELDALHEPERPQPTAADRTGSPASLVKWNELGRTGRRFIASGPNATEISAVSGRPAQDPVRVYVGLAGGATAQARARLALEELKRQRGFDRKILIVVTPTGTGWIDPAAMDTVEYLHHGDVASVAMQYSYLNSPMSLLFQPEYGAEAARALFAEIYGYWTTLPRDRRPKLYLHGLSLGAMNSEKSAELFEMIGDPIAGALWSGAPFESRLWRSITANRNPGSPAWLPEFRDNRFVRFMNQNGSTVPADAPWGPMRVVYLQYASDAITFFAYRDAYQAPAWMSAPRGPDVSPELRWYPIVTMLQLALDMAVATNTPMGFGHVYAPEHYVDAWIAVTDVHDWSAEALAQLKEQLAAKARTTGASNIDDDSDRGG
ncbi:MULTISPECIES: alpha/beta hydrolase [Bradyrhizobium]|uniref:Membrane protein n=1 Tax=Bradyrhizobium ottawaense TaxID=931866 RepID=A0ABV4G048_9BRAD|nr:MULTISPECIES: alpha/beta-hydrolase family protein [Bradyrhizobium]MBR1289669.1 alpha/beta-hydrolase family protein [Bradyrhizobium ottawaense]MDA9418034.1 membrane protein [Bradyrhizobium sp. CCBAU 25360]MDA9484767.1 membrane protein [Bradyrhizobium sp. CCBAU 11445]WLB48739.1 alpha/beta-hydrolase family protein [Bradyrhizobium ottawaense]WQN86059.1 alpha/beta-hydrolase family protein [Bradyrhizobium ottawaense]